MNFINLLVPRVVCRTKHNRCWSNTGHLVDINMKFNHNVQFYSLFLCKFNNVSHTWYYSINMYVHCLEIHHIFEFFLFLKLVMINFIFVDNACIFSVKNRKKSVIFPDNMSIEHWQLETHTQRTGLHNCVHPGIEFVQMKIQWNLFKQ